MDMANKPAVNKAALSEEEILKMLAGHKSTDANYRVGRIAGVLGAVVAGAHRTVTNGVKPSTVVGTVVGGLVGYKTGKMADGFSGLTGSHSPIADVGAFTAGYGVTLGMSALAGTFDQYITPLYESEEETEE